VFIIRDLDYRWLSNRITPAHDSGTDMTDHLTFECPHCKQPVDVKEERLGGNVDCPHCDHTFQAKAPLGRLLSDRPDREGVASASVDGETTLKVVRPVLFRQHVVLTAVFALLLGIAGVGLAMSLLGRALFGIEGGLLLILSLVAAGLALAYGVGRWLNTLSTSLTITSSRSILRKGILSSRTSEVQHDDIRNIKADRSTLERLLNYGDIAISSSGQDDFEIVINDIPDPEGVLKIIRSHQSSHP
jgi:predicted Zn finger-like uncharacterized protein